MFTQSPDVKDKIGTAAAYLTLGIWGFIWLLISRTSYYEQKAFIRFHCFQSIFIGVLYMFIPQGLAILFSLVIQFFGFIPSTSSIVSLLHTLHDILQTIIHYGFFVLILYCVIICFYGKYTNIPFISQMINRMMR